MPSVKCETYIRIIRIVFATTRKVTFTAMAGLWPAHWVRVSFPGRLPERSMPLESNAHRPNLALSAIFCWWLRESGGQRSVMPARNTSFSFMEIQSAALVPRR